MAVVSIYSMSGAEKSKKEFTDLPPLNNFKGLVWEGVVNYLANQRQGTASTKGRSDVKCTNKKPWPQKGRGTARAGSAASPIWRGGGVVFGPKPRDYSYELPKKKKKKIYQVLWTHKIENGLLKVVDNLSFEKPKTKDFISVLKNLGLTDKKVLVITKDVNKNVYFSGRNLPKVKVLPFNNINVFDLAKYDYVLTTEEVLSDVEGVLQ